MWITARQIYITKCILWILGAIIIPIFLWWRPVHIYKTDKSSVKIANTYRGKKFEFDAENSFGHKIHAHYSPQKEYYVLTINGGPERNACNCVDNNSFIYKDTHIFMCTTGYYLAISFIIFFLQLFIVVTSSFSLSDYDDIIEREGGKHGFYIRTPYYVKDSFLFHKLLGLYTTEEQLININKFFGFDNIYLKNNNS